MRFLEISTQPDGKVRGYVRDDSIGRRIAEKLADELLATYDLVILSPTDRIPQNARRLDR